ncbi:hypothetical protein ACGFZB_03685 [Streptomyces cinerochromogenes]|uniref:Uncharacterized protein n=1 Tax=Streptomyces cinerochromogenes TaxID=66422 RepID=A0ABW7AXC7_9ACTN
MIMVTAGALASLAAGAPPAAAEAANGCAELDVCFYRTANDWAQGRPTASYRGVTRFPQELGADAYGAYAVHSALGEERATLHMTATVDGRAYGICLAPHEQRVLQPDTVSTVHIDGKAGC